MMEMIKKEDIVLAKLWKTQRKFAEYKEKNPKDTLFQEVIIEFAKNG